MHQPNCMRIYGPLLIKVAVVCHTFVLWPSILSAQITVPREAAQIEIGPLSVYPSLRVIDAGKDNNIFNEENTPKEDFTFTIASRAVAVLKLGLNELLFSSGNDYVWFRDFADERSSNARYAARVNISANRFKPFVGVERQHTRSRPNSEIDARALRLERSVVAGFSLSTADRTDIIASATVDDSTYAQGQRYRGADLADALNRVSRKASAGIRYKITPLTSLAINANYGEDRFPDSHIRDARSYSVVPALEFSSFEVNGGRLTRYSYQDLQPYYLSTGAHLTVSQRLFGPVDLLGGADWEHMAYRWYRGEPSNRALDNTNTLTGQSAGVGVNIGRSFRVTVGADRTERRSAHNPRQTYRRTRLVSSVTIGS